MKKAMWVVLMAALALSLTGCDMLMGKDGKAYGAIWWPDSYVLYQDYLTTTGGFPSVVYKNTFYEIQPGSHYFQYQLYDSASDTFSAIWDVYYTVTLDKGELFSDGEDVKFWIDCYFYAGPDIYEVNRAPESPGDPSPKSVSQMKRVGNYTISLEAHQVEPTPEILSNMKPLR